MISSAAVLAGAGLVLGTWLCALNWLFVPDNRMARAICRAYRAVAGVSIPAARSVAAAGVFGAAVVVLVADLAGFALLAWALCDVPLHVGEVARFLVWHPEEGWRSDGGVLAALAWVSTLLLLLAFGSYLGRFAEAYLRRERPLVRLAAEFPGVPDAELLLARFLPADPPQELDAVFGEWADWLVDLECSQAGNPVLAFCPPVSDLSWPDAALMVLDAAALGVAVAPGWAPAGSRALLEVGTHCLQRTTDRLGLVVPPTTVSLHGREERGFGASLDFLADAGLRIERDERSAWLQFQADRTRYAPQAAAISAYLYQSGESRRGAKKPALAT